MEEIFLNISISPQMIYLSIMLIVLGVGLKNLPFISKWMIIWILLIISILINFIFYGVKFDTLFEAIIATAIAVFGYDVFIQTKKGIRSIKG